MYSQVSSFILICFFLSLACDEQQNTTMLSSLDNVQRDAGLTLGDQVSAGMESTQAGSVPLEETESVNEDEAEEGGIELNAGSTETSDETMGGLQSMAGNEAINMTDTESNMPESENDQSNQNYGDAEGNFVLCGDQSCDLTTDTCCLREFGASCVEGANTTCNLGGTQLICDGPEDCNGGQCCLGVGLPGELSCSPTSCVNLTLCHAEQDCAEDQICRRCQFTGVELAVCSRPNIIPNLALSCD